MLNASTIVFLTVLAIEVFLIIVGNSFTIFVFWTQRFHLKRTSFLLINLAVADLLAGIAQVVVLTAQNITNGEKEALRKPDVNFFWAFQVSGLITSVMFLAVISLERVSAVLWPLRHRVISTRVYIYSITTVWVAGICVAGLQLTTYFAKVDRIYATVTIGWIFFISLTVICVSYVAIRSRLRCSIPELQVHQQNSIERSLQISKTLFLVVAVSLVFFLLTLVVSLIEVFCSQCYYPIVLWLVNILHLGNSVVNPFIYSFKMPIFKDALRKCWRKRRQNIELRTIPLSLHNETQTGECNTRL